MAKGAAAALQQNQADDTKSRIGDVRIWVFSMSHPYGDVIGRRLEPETAVFARSA